MTPWSTVILEKLPHPQVVTKFLHFMEPKGSLPRSWTCITCPVLSQTILVQAPYPISLRFILILFPHLCLGLPNGSLPWRFPTKILYAHLLSPIMCHMPCPSHSSWFEHLNTHIIFVEEYRIWSSSSHSIQQSPVNSSLKGPNIFLSTQFSNTLNLYSPLTVKDQVSHPYKTTKSHFCIFQSL